MRLAIAPQPKLVGMRVVAYRLAAWRRHRRAVAHRRDGGAGEAASALWHSTWCRPAGDGIGAGGEACAPGGKRRSNFSNFASCGDEMAALFHGVTRRASRRRRYWRQQRPSARAHGVILACLGIFNQQSRRHDIITPLEAVALLAPDIMAAARRGRAMTKCGLDDRKALFSAALLKPGGIGRRRRALRPGTKAPLTAQHNRRGAAWRQSRKPGTSWRECHSSSPSARPGGCNQRGEHAPGARMSAARREMRRP